MTCQVFLGQYGRLDLIRVWKISPALYGIGISYILKCAIILLRTASRAAVKMIYFLSSFEDDLIYNKCPEESEHTHGKCFEKAEDVPANLSCESDFDFVAEYNFKHRISSPRFAYTFESASMNVYDSLMLFWIMTFLIASLTLNRISKIVPIIFLVGIVVTTVFIFDLIKSDTFFFIAHMFKIKLSDFLDPNLWYSALAVVIDITNCDLGIYVAIGQMLNTKISPQYYVLTLLVIHYSAGILLCTLLYALRGRVLKQFGLDDIRCMKSSTSILAFTMIPEYIRGTSMNHHLLNGFLYFSFLFVSVIYM
ncbi:hypothetical protein L9F63_013610, partial [Diploptera punctata]